MIFFRIIYFTFIKKIILIRLDIIFCLFIIFLESIKINFGLYNLGIIVRHRIPIYLLFCFIFILQSRYNYLYNQKNILCLNSFYKKPNAE